jgi:hypothetical protein
MHLPHFPDAHLSALHGPMNWLIRDLRFGIRTIAKDRGFFAIAVVALALGIGSTTAIFSVLDNVLLQPFPYTDSQRIFAITIHDSKSEQRQGRQWFYVPEFLDDREQNHIFRGSMGVWEQTVIMGGATAPESFDADLMTGNSFDFPGVPALLAEVRHERG